MPQTADLILATHIPNRELHNAVMDCLHIEADGWYYGYLLSLDVNNSLVIASIHDTNFYLNPQTTKLVAHNFMAQITNVLQI